MDQRKSLLLKRQCEKCKKSMVLALTVRSLIPIVGLLSLLVMIIGSIFVDFTSFQGQQILAVPFLIFMISAPITFGLHAFERQRKYKCRRCGNIKIEEYAIKLGSRRALEFALFILSLIVVPLVIAGAVAYYFIDKQ